MLSVSVVFLGTGAAGPGLSTNFSATSTGEVPRLHQNSERDDVPLLGMFTVTAFTVLSSLTVRLLAFLHKKVTASGQVPHRQRWTLRNTLRNVAEVTVRQEPV